jgi:hypothetical protein
MNPITFALRHPVTVITGLAALALGISRRVQGIRLSFEPADIVNEGMVRRRSCSRPPA